MTITEEEYKFYVEKSKIYMELTKEVYMLNQGFDYLSSLLDSSVFCRQEIVDGLKVMVYEEVSKFFEDFYKDMRSDIYFSGNVLTDFA